MRILLIVLALMVCLPAATAAGTWNWRPVGPGGGLVKAVAVTPSGETWFVGISDGGLFRSSDGGVTWEPVTAMGGRWVPSIAVDPTNPARIYAGTDGGGVYVSSDGGNAWSPLGLDGKVISAIAVDPANGSRIYAGTGCNWGCTYEGIYRSEDSGASWTQVTNGYEASGYVFTLAVRPDGAVFAGANPGLYRSGNHGDSWERIGPPEMMQSILSIAFRPGSPSTMYAGTAQGGLFRSTDGGTSWTPINTGLDGVPGVNTSIYGLAIDPGAANRMYAGVSTKGVYRSDTGGDSWYPATAGLTHPEIRALVLDPANPAILLAGTYGHGLRRTMDRGASWAQTNTGLNAIQVLALATGPGDPPSIYAGTFGSGIFRSRDGGQTWDSQPYPFPCADSQSQSILVHPADPQIVLAGVNSWTAGICRSTDGGGTWSSVALGGAAVPGEAQNIWGLAVSSAGTGPVFAASSSGIWKSGDKGATWTRSGLTNVWTTAIAVHPASPQILFAGTLDSRIYRSSDGGASWVTAGSPGAGIIRSIAISPLDPSIILAGGEGFGVYRSTDGGATWSMNWDAAGWSIVFQPWAPQVAYAGGYNQGVSRSSDSGATWERINTSSNAPNFDVRALAIGLNAPVLFAGSGSFIGGATGVFATDIDDGTWGMEPPVIKSIAADPSVLWPANHKLVQVLVTVGATSQSGPVTSQIVSVTSNEPDNGLGDSDTPDDIQEIAGLTVKLRAERSGTGNGRIYTIRIKCTDANGRSSLGAVNVTVPHSR